MAEVLLDKVLVGIRQFEGKEFESLDGVFDAGIGICCGVLESSYNGLSCSWSYKVAYLELKFTSRDNLGFNADGHGGGCGCGCGWCSHLEDWCLCGCAWRFVASAWRC